MNMKKNFQSKKRESEKSLKQVPQGSASHSPSPSTGGIINTITNTINSNNNSSHSNNKEGDGAILKKPADPAALKATVRSKIPQTRQEERKIGPFPEWRPTNKEPVKPPHISMTQSYRDLLPVIKVFIGQAYELPKQGVYFKISIGSKSGIKSKTVSKTNYPVFNEEVTIIIERSDRNPFHVQIQLYEKKPFGFAVSPIVLASCSFDLVETLGMAIAGDTRKYKFPLNPGGEVDLTFTAETDLVFPTMKMADVIGLKDTSLLESQEGGVTIELIVYQAMSLMLTRRVISFVDVYLKTRGKTKTLFKTKNAPGYDPYWCDSGTVTILSSKDVLRFVVTSSFVGAAGKEEGTIELPVESLRDLFTKTESQRWFNISGLGGLIGLGFKALTNPDILDKLDGVVIPPGKISMDGAPPLAKKDTAPLPPAVEDFRKVASEVAPKNIPTTASTNTTTATATTGATTATADPITPKKKEGILSGNPFLADSSEEEEEESDGSDSDSGGGTKKPKKGGILAGNPFLDGVESAISETDDISTLASELESVLDSPRPHSEDNHTNGIDKKPTAKSVDMKPTTTTASTTTSSPTAATTTATTTATTAAATTTTTAANASPTGPGKDDIISMGAEQLGELIKSLLKSYNLSKQTLEDDISKLKVVREAEEKDVNAQRDQTLQQLKQQQEEELKQLQQKHQLQLLQHQEKYQQRLHTAQDEYTIKFKKVNEAAQKSFTEYELKIRVALGTFKQKTQILKTSQKQAQQEKPPSASQQSQPQAQAPQNYRYSEVKLSCNQCNKLLPLSMLSPILSGRFNYCQNCGAQVIAKQTALRQSRVAELQQRPKAPVEEQEDDEEVDEDFSEDDGDMDDSTDDDTTKPTTTATTNTNTTTTTTTTSSTTSTTNTTKPTTATTNTTTTTTTITSNTTSTSTTTISATTMTSPQLAAKTANKTTPSTPVTPPTPTTTATTTATTATTAKVTPFKTATPSGLSSGFMGMVSKVSNPNFRNDHKKSVEERANRGRSLSGGDNRNSGSGSAINNPSASNSANIPRSNRSADFLKRSNPTPSKLINQNNNSNSNIINNNINKNTNGGLLNGKSTSKSNLRVSVDDTNVTFTYKPRDPVTPTKTQQPQSQQQQSQQSSQQPHKIAIQHRQFSQPNMSVSQISTSGSSGLLAPSSPSTIHNGLSPLSSPRNHLGGSAGNLGNNNNNNNNNSNGSLRDTSELNSAMCGLCKKHFPKFEMRQIATKSFCGPCTKRVVHGMKQRENERTINNSSTSSKESLKQ